MKFAQYDTATGLFVASNSARASDEILAALGRAQIEVPDEFDLARHRMLDGSPVNYEPPTEE